MGKVALIELDFWQGGKSRIDKNILSARWEMKNSSKKDMQAVKSKLDKKSSLKLLSSQVRNMTPDSAPNTTCLQRR